MYKTAFIDTGFLIRFLDANHDQHASAVSYYSHLQKNGYVIRMSTIAIAEYCVKGEYDDIPTKNILISPFNAMHAVKAGMCARCMYEERAKWVKTVGGRDIIKNDVKIMAQAGTEGADCYVTFDTDSKRLYDILKAQRLVSFSFWDANKPVSVYTGDIPFPDS